MARASEWTARDLTGPIPPELGALTRLGNLYLEYNHLTGRIPPELGALTNLVDLKLSDNDLTGSLPRELGALTNLGILSLPDNDLTGPLPSEMTNLRLHFLNIQNNAGLCVPADAEFQAWVATIATFFGDICRAVPAAPPLALLLLGLLLLSGGAWLRARRHRA